MIVQFRSPSGLKGLLALFIALALVIAIGVAIAVVAIGVFVVLVPILVVTTALYYLFPRARFSRGRRTASGRPDTIDGEFRVLNSRDIDQERR